MAAYGFAGAMLKLHSVHGLYFVYFVLTAPGSDLVVAGFSGLPTAIAC